MKILNKTSDNVLYNSLLPISIVDWKSIFLSINFILKKCPF